MIHTGITGNTKEGECTVVPSQMPDCPISDCIQSSVWFWSKLTNIRCSGLRMVVGHCEECTFWSVILDDTVMAGFRFVKSVILGCQFTDTALSNLRLKKCEMSHLKLSNVMLTDVVFDRCIFKELDLEHITFEKVKFKNCYFDKLPETIPEGCKLSLIHI